MSDVYVIVDPIGHRVAEHHAAEQREAELDGEDVAFIFVSPADPNEWFCDRCMATIDIDRPIVVHLDDALCPTCAAPILGALTDTSTNGPVFRVPVCSCRPCHLYAQRNASN